MPLGIDIVDGCGRRNKTGHEHLPEKTKNVVLAVWFIRTHFDSKTRRSISVIYKGK